MKISGLIVSIASGIVVTLALVGVRAVQARSANLLTDTPDSWPRIPPEALRKVPRNPAPFASTNAAVVTENGPVKSTVAFGVEQFLAIPYAAPPVGNLRWMPPQPHARWHGVLRSSNFGSRCIQQDGSGSEDCLTLNVFRPIAHKNQNKSNPLPVMVWIHGGGLVSGGSADYQPDPLVRAGNVIVVTINYRLGILGFFAHPAIDAEGHLNGNYGLMDQQFALRWVQRNIAAFGGDPNRVTIFGESAGGQSVYAQLASPTAAGLFQRAISQSGAYSEFQDYLDFIIPLAQGETIGTGLVPSGIAQAQSVGCPDQTATCLRALPASTLALAASVPIVPICRRNDTYSDAGIGLRQRPVQSSAGDLRRDS